MEEMDKDFQMEDIQGIKIANMGEVAYYLFIINYHSDRFTDSFEVAYITNKGDIHNKEGDNSSLEQELEHIILFDHYSIYFICYFIHLDNYFHSHPPYSCFSVRMMNILHFLYFYTFIDS